MSGEISQEEKIEYSPKLAEVLRLELEKIREFIIQDNQEALMGAFIINPKENSDAIDYILKKIADSDVAVCIYLQIPIVYRSLLPQETLRHMYDSLETKKVELEVTHKSLDNRDMPKYNRLKEILGIDNCCCN